MACFLPRKQFPHMVKATGVAQVQCAGPPRAARVPSPPGREGSSGGRDRATENVRRRRSFPCRDWDSWNFPVNLGRFINS